MTKNRVVHFEVQANDVERAKEFYEKAFGWKINMAMSKAKGEIMDYWIIMTGEKGEPGINGGLYERPMSEADGERYYLFDCTIEVENIDEAIKAVKDAGGTITREKSELPEVGWFASAKDTEGNRFSLMQSTMKEPR